MNSMKLVIPLHSLYWSNHTKDDFSSKRATAFAFIFGVNWLWRCGVTASLWVFFHEMKFNGTHDHITFQIYIYTLLTFGLKDTEETVKHRKLLYHKTHLYSVNIYSLCFKYINHDKINPHILICSIDTILQEIIESGKVLNIKSKRFIN